MASSSSYSSEGSKSLQRLATSSMRAGILMVHLKRGEDIKGDKSFGLGRADPYAVLSVGNKVRSNKMQLKSSVRKNAASNPEWNEDFPFIIEKACADDCFLYISVYNKNFFRDNLIGDVKIDLLQVLDKDNDAIPPDWYPVRYKKKQWGRVLLSLKFQAFQPMDTSNAPMVSHFWRDPTLVMSTLGTLVGAGQLLLAAVPLIIAAVHAILNLKSWLEIGWSGTRRAIPLSNL